MRFCAIVMAAALATGCASHEEARAPQASLGGVPIAAGTSYLLHSDVLGDDREVNVWVPPGYGTGLDHYDVLYVLDGAVAQDFPHIAGLGQLGTLSGTYQSLIVVGVETKDRQHELTPAASDARYVRAFPRGGGAVDFRRFLRDEVFQFVETRFRAGQRRALIGESLAGLFVVDTLLRDPTLFNDYIAISPSLWWDDRALSREAPTLLTRHDGTERRLYLAIANEGGTMRDGVNRLMNALRDGAPAGLTVSFVDGSSSDTHATIYHGAALDALRRFYVLPGYDEGPQPWFMVEGASPP